MREIDVLLDKMMAEKAAAEAKEKVSAAQAAKEAEWLRGYAKQKTVYNFGGNYWGINRNRCNIIRPAMIKALVAGGHIKMNGDMQFKMV